MSEDYKNELLKNGFCPHCEEELTRQDIGKLFGSLGGRAVKNKPKEHWISIGKKGAEVRWGNKDKT